MEITVNGQHQDYAGPPLITGLLESLGINPQVVVVERNLRIVPGPELDMEPVHPGDIIEIIRFVGGG